MSNIMLPINPRYQEKAGKLVTFFGYDRLYSPYVEVEIAVLQVLGEIGVIPLEIFELLTLEIIEKLRTITTSEIDVIENKITRHDIRALVRRIQEIIPDELMRFVHVPLTSYDVIDTARALMYYKAHQVVKQAMYEVIFCMKVLVRKYANVIQGGRTHGQAAIPVTVGFWLANVLHRLTYNFQQMEYFVENLVGKISGPVGSYNAQVAFGIAEKCGRRTFEHRVLDKLGINPAPISSQIVPPEPLAYYLYSTLMATGVFGQLGRDARNLARSEIAEITEPVEPGQIGSSSMPQKINPISFENLEGTFIKTMAEFHKVLLCLISDHQRDLVNSSVMRDFPAIVCNLMIQTQTLLKEDKQGIPFILRMNVNEECCRTNFERSADLIMAEPFYIALQLAGFKGDGHKLVKALAKKVRLDGGTLIDQARKMADPEAGLGTLELELHETLEQIPEAQLGMIGKPETYTGWAGQKSLEVAATAESLIGADFQPFQV